MLAWPILAGELDGKWKFVWQTPGGERESVVAIAVDGESVSCDFPENKAPIKGRFKDGRLELTGKLYSSEAGMDGDFKLTGKLVEGRIEGESYWNEHGMTFVAKKSE